MIIIEETLVYKSGFLKIFFTEVTLVYSVLCFGCIMLLIYCISVSVGFPGGSVVKNLPAVQEIQVRSPDQEDPLEKEMATHSSTLSCKSYGQRSLVGYSSQCHKELDITE